MSNELDREPKVIVYHIDGKKDGDAVTPWEPTIYPSNSNGSI
jgi:hypothetical protein